MTADSDGPTIDPAHRAWAAELFRIGREARANAKPNDAVPRPTRERPDAAHEYDDAEPRPITDPAAYARRALDTAVENVTGAHEGFRNHTLNAAAYSLGRLVGAELLEEATAADTLRTAAEEVGLGSIEIERTIESGLRAGALRPFAWVRSEPVRLPKATPFVPTSLPAEEIAHAWRPVDIAPVLDGTYTAPEPTVGGRSDGVGLFYPGRVHLVFSETEGGKTWLALAAIRTEIERGRGAVFLDFEDDEGGVVGRLLALGARPDDLRDRFAYIRPDAMLDDLGRSDLRAVLGDLTPSLVVLDGVTEAMTMHGLEIGDNGDVARFGLMLPRWLADFGPAVVQLDHVVKDAANRGRYAMGGAHKLNGLNGSAFMLENRVPFGVAATGRSTIRIAKDRPGQLRRHSLPGGDRPAWYGDLVIESLASRSVDVSIVPPVERSDDFRPTYLMDAIRTALLAAVGDLTTNDICDRVTGRREDVRKALACLIDEGQVTIESGPNRSRLHRLYTPEEAPD